MVKFKDYVGFYRAAKQRKKSHQHYIKFENFQASIVMNFLRKNKVSLKGKRVLDIGCGRGGYAFRFNQGGARVAAIDITREYFQNVNGIDFVLADATQMPLKSDSFDFVFCSSLIEHVLHPENLVSEIKRVLNKGGVCYLSFPPFWSPVGAHQFKPFHYLGERAATTLARKLYHTKSYAYDDVYGKLKIRKIGQVKKWILKSGLEIKSITTRMSPINFAKIPLINELLTWHVEFLVKKV